MSTFALLSLLVTLGALFSFLSFRVLRLPTSIGTMILTLGASAALVLGGGHVPGLHAAAQRIVGGIDFNAVVLHGMLALLLFAGALQLDLQQLAREKLSVTVLSIGSTALSTVLVAVVFGFGLRAIGIPISVMGALLFGALISPTDPIAVLEMLQRVGASRSLSTQLAGESLFNDGVGAVIFLALLSASSGGAAPSVKGFLVMLTLKAGGGILLGAGLGYVTFRLLCQVDQYRVELLLTLALAMGGYALADALKLSAPLEVITAGMLVSGRAKHFAMSENTRGHFERFWEVVDDMFNVVLFLLLGLQLLVLPIDRRYVVAGLLAIPAVLLARWVSVALPVGILNLFHERVPGTVAVLTWGGLRGGLAVALALSVPHGQGLERNTLLVATYVVVVFSILVQGLTISPLLRRLKLTSTHRSMAHQT
ncbi:MAG TPA: cation:proton antiporter [Acidobacteriaceae bacterium]|nr:cation:proton antiporter [Acidobacteriaceae bacterium]